MGPDPLDSSHATQFTGGILALQEAIRDLITSSWDETQLQRAQELVHALLQAAKLDRYWESESLLRALDSLLGLPLQGDPAQRMAIGLKVAEIVSLLKRAPTSTRSA